LLINLNYTPPVSSKRMRGSWHTTHSKNALLHLLMISLILLKKAKNTLSPMNYYLTTRIYMLLTQALT